MFIRKKRYILKRNGRYLVGCDFYTGDQIWGKRGEASTLDRDAADRLGSWLQATVEPAEVLVKV